MLLLKNRLQAALARDPTLSQAGLHRATGATTASVSNWFTGKSINMKAANLRLAADYLGCSQRWLETGLGDPGWIETHHPSEGAHTGAPVAQDLSHPRLQTAPVTSREVPVIGTLHMGNSNDLELRASPDGAAIGHVQAYSAAPGSFAVREVLRRTGLWPTLGLLNRSERPGS